MAFGGKQLLKVNIHDFGKKPPLLLTLTLYGATPHNGQTHSNKSSAKADKLFECV